jgi:hypothetical protein
MLIPLLFGLLTAVPVVQVAEVPELTVSSAEAIALHLRKINAKMYGAYWCPACTRQREIFGDQAFQQVQYIECDPRGINPKPQLCRRAGIQVYPTWEIKGKKYQGVRSLAELAELSGFMEGK